MALAPELLNGTYSGSKAYVVNFTQALKHELEGKGVTVQAVLPGAISTPFWDKAGLPVHHLPDATVMTAENLVDASLAGLDQGELITIPSLPEIADWEKFEAARKAMGEVIHRFFGDPGLQVAATRYARSEHQTAIARLRERLTVPGFASSLSPLERAELELLAASPLDFVSCVARGAQNKA